MPALKSVPALFSSNASDVAAFDDGCGSFAQADRAADAARGHGVVAGDHDDADAGAPAGLDGVRHVGARRVFQRDETDESQTLIGRGFGVVGALAGAGQHAQAVMAEMFDALVPMCAGFVIERGQAVIGQHALRCREHGLRRAFDRIEEVVAVAVHGRHHLGRAIEGMLTDDRAVAQQRAAFEAGEPAGAQQRELHRIAGAFIPAGGKRGVIAEHGDLHQTGKRRVAGRGGKLGRAAGHFDLAGRHPEAAHRHPVFGQRAGLVGENDGGGAQRFDRRQAFDQRILARHAPHAARQRQRRDNGQTLPEWRRPRARWPPR